MKFLIILTVGCFMANANAWIIRDAAKRFRDRVNPKESKPKLAAFNKDDQLDLLDDLSLQELLAIADENKDDNEALNLIVETYQRKFDKPIVIHNYNDDNIHISNGRIVAPRFDEVSTLFKYFGHILTNVDVFGTAATENLVRDAVKGVRNGRTPEEETKEILKIINEYSHDSLKALTLSHSGKNPLQYVDQTFVNVENFTLKNEAKDIGSEYGTLRSDKYRALNDSLPNLRRLFLDHVSVKDVESLVVSFKQLEVLETSLGYDASIHTTHIEQLIAQNQGIRNASISHGSLSLLQALSKLPRLENLEISFVRSVEYNDKLNFADVKSLKLDGSIKGKNNFATFVNFEQLEDLEITSNAAATIEWIDFVRSNRNLEKLRLSFYEMNEGQLMMLSGKFPNLIEASFYMQRKLVSAEAINGFLNGSDKLKSLSILFPDSHIGATGTKEQNQSIEANLKAQFSKEWTVAASDVGYSDRSIVFTRK